jgi:branched-chain amino acid transport system substrate-binding protein
MVLVAASYTLLTATPATAAPAKGVIELGLVGTLSGSLAPDDGPIELGVEAGVAYINAHGGLAGRQVVLHTADDTGSPVTFLLQTKNFVQSDHVVAFVGDAAPGTAQGGSSYLEQVKVPVIGGNNQNPLYETSSDFYNIETKLSAINPDSVAVAEKYSHAKKLGLVYCSEVAACLAAKTGWQQAASKTGAQFVYSAAVPLTQVDLTPECLAAKAAGVQALGLLEVVQSQVALEQDCATQGYHPTYVTATGNVGAPQLAIPALNGLLAMSQSVPSFAKGHILDTLRKWYPHVTAAALTTESVNGWEAAMTLVYASKYFPKSGSVTSADIVSALHKINGSTLGGLVPPLVFGKPGKPNSGTSCYYPVEVANGQWATLSGQKYVCP